jgi:hypothetical protein
MAPAFDVGVTTFRSRAHPMGSKEFEAWQLKRQHSGQAVFGVWKLGLAR